MQKAAIATENAQCSIIGQQVTSPHRLSFFFLSFHLLLQGLFSSGDGRRLGRVLYMICADHEGQGRQRRGRGHREQSLYRRSPQLCIGHRRRRRHAVRPPSHHPSSTPFLSRLNPTPCVDCVRWRVLRVRWRVLRVLCGLRIRMNDSRSVMLDFREVAPAAAKVDMFVGKPGLRCVPPHTCAHRVSVFKKAADRSCHVPCWAWFLSTTARWAVWPWPSPASWPVSSTPGSTTARATYVHDSGHDRRSAARRH